MDPASRLVSRLVYGADFRCGVYTGEGRTRWEGVGGPKPKRSQNLPEQNLAGNQTKIGDVRPDLGSIRRPVKTIKRL